ncbi:MAG: alpha/beta fold hydrolase [Betaproteobacteria bacterium]|nr:alpha/beta fold hydrolase [Betaproteobacteria bacterium]
MATMTSNPISKPSIVLVHGAWHCAWCWRRVVPLLQAAGHPVFAPTLTGLADRAHLLDRSIDLDTHIQDVIGVLDHKELIDVVLVGHSYAGGGDHRCGRPGCFAAEEPRLPRCLSPRKPQANGRLHQSRAARRDHPSGRSQGGRRSAGCRALWPRTGNRRYGMGDSSDDQASLWHDGAAALS